MFCIILYHTATIFKGPAFYPGHQLAHLCPSSSPKSLSSRRFRNEHAVHNKDWRHSEQGRRKRSNGQCCQWADGNFYIDKHHICFARSNMIWIHQHMTRKLSANTRFRFHVSMCWYSLFIPQPRNPSGLEASRGKLLPPWMAVGLSPWKCQIHKQATCPVGEERSENPEEPVHDLLHMSWNQGKRWIHNKYSDSRKISKSHCSPNTDYLFFKHRFTKMIRCVRHTDQPGWWHASCTNTGGTTTAKQDVWCRQTPESNTSKIKQAFTVAMLPFSCIQGSSLEAF